MNVTPIVTDHVMEIWSWCSDAYLRHGSKLTFPLHTDPTKTYQWRYAKAIASKFQEWGFDNDTAKRFIDIAVLHAKTNGVICKGLAVLHQHNMMHICYDKLLSDSKATAGVLDSLRQMQRWFLAKLGNGDKIAELLKCPSYGSLCNLTIWYQASRLSPLFLALSKTCGVALAKLVIVSSAEREMMPTATTLYLTRSRFIREPSHLAAARRIFVSDWREPCLK